MFCDVDDVTILVVILAECNGVVTKVDSNSVCVYCVVCIVEEGEGKETDKEGNGTKGESTSHKKHTYMGTNLNSK